MQYKMMIQGPLYQEFTSTLSTLEACGMDANMKMHSCLSSCSISTVFTMYNYLPMGIRLMGSQVITVIEGIHAVQAPV